jgi:hypothetical protein
MSKLALVGAVAAAPEAGLGGRVGAFGAGEKLGGELGVVLPEADAAAAGAVGDLAAIKPEGAEGGEPRALGAVLALWSCWH